jgi:hypothetical protein
MSLEPQSSSRVPDVLWKVLGFEALLGKRKGDDDDDDFNGPRPNAVNTWMPALRQSLRRPMAVA